MGNCPGSPLCCPCPAFSYFSLTYDPCLRSRCPFARHSSLAINSHLLHDVAICEADSKVGLDRSAIFILISDLIVEVQHRDFTIRRSSVSKALILKGYIQLVYEQQMIRDFI
ncbi:hypothetical protein NC651_013396 [Populus alba x Populus x berolinensis]|nr:hypothetical protein NC651_013396 [Populus alba x Populus x berolinensis]